MKRLAPALLVCGLVAWSACTAPSRTSTRPSPPPPSIPAFPAGQVPPPAQLLELARARVAPLLSLGAVLKIRGLAQLPMATVLADAWVARPAWTYLGVRGPLGPPVDEFATDGTTWRWKSIRPGAGGRGGAVADAGAPLPVPPDRFVGTLWGLPVPDTPPVRVEACEPGDLATPPLPFCIHAAWDLGTQAWLHGDATGVVHRADVLHAGQAATLLYSDVAPVDGVPLARRIRILAADTGTRELDVRLLEVFPNAPRPGPLFDALLGVATPTHAPVDAPAPP